MELEFTRYFVKVVQNGSFSRAAELMRVPKSTVSKAITKLENETGTKLLLRTTRSLTLTAAGRAFYDSSVGPIQSLEDAQKSLYGQDSILAGRLKITAPEDLGTEILAPAIAKLASRHPQLEFELIYTNQIVDLIKDGFDLAFRIGKLTESNFKAKRLGEIFLILVASPEYLKSKEKIKTPKDLEKHECLSYREQTLHARWSLRNKKETADIAITPRVSSNQMTSLMKMAISGGGIALIPHYLCRAEIKAGHLVEVLPGWRRAGYPVSMVSPLSVASSARLKTTADHLSEVVQRALVL